MKMVLAKFKSLALVVIAGFSSNSFASEQILNEHVYHINTYSSLAVIQLEGTALNIDQCTKGNAGKYVAIVYTDGKEMFSSALSAYMANRKIGFGLSGCQPWGETTIPKAYRVDIYRD